MRGTAALAAPMLSILGAASPSAAAPPDPAHALMVSVNREYELLRPIPRQATLRVEATISARGMPDRRTRGSAVVVQRDGDVRYDMDVDLVERADGAPATADRLTPGGHLAWVVTDGFLRVRYAQPAGSGVADQEYKVDLRKLPEAASSRFRDPMSDPELAAQYLTTPFTREDRVVDGRVLTMLRSQTAVAFSSDSRAFVTLWVDPESLLIVRAAYEGSYRPSPNADPYWYSTSMDVSYKLQVPIAEGAFALDLRPDAEDATPLVADEGRAGPGPTP